VRIVFGFRYPKTAVLIAAACFYVPFVADWCEPGLALQQAAVAQGALPGVAHPYFWSKVVRLVGRNVSLLGTVSMVSAFVCSLLIALLAGLVVDAALRALQRRVSLSDETADELRGSAEFLTALAFILTPGFFHAATHIGPLHFLLIPLLAGLAFLLFLARFLTTGEESKARRFKQSIGPMFLALAFLLYAFFELALSYKFLQSEKRTFVVFLLVGILPLAIFSHLIRHRLLLARRALNLFLVLWAFLIAGFGARSVGTAGRGQVASRVVRHILDNAGNCKAVVSDGAFDEMFHFMLSEDQRLILLSRGADREYSRDLADWVLKVDGDRSELYFAAELGMRAFVDECEQQGDSERGILTPSRYFSTLGEWRAACAEIFEMDDLEPAGTDLRNLLGKSGERLGRRCLDAGETAEAWAVFWEVLNCVDPANRLALADLSDMIARGYTISREERRKMDLLLEEDGQKRRKREPLPMMPSMRVQEFIRTVSLTPQTRDEAIRMREMIRSGLASGRVNLTQVGTQLLTLDLWLDEWECAERDALDILRNDRRHRKANDVMGSAASSRGDQRAAEHYFRQAGMKEQKTEEMVR